MAVAQFSVVLSKINHQPSGTRYMLSTLIAFCPYDKDDERHISACLCKMHTCIGRTLFSINIGRESIRLRRIYMRRFGRRQARWMESVSETPFNQWCRYECLDRDLYRWQTLKTSNRWKWGLFSRVEFSFRLIWTI